MDNAVPPFRVQVKWSGNPNWKDTQEEANDPELVVELAQEWNSGLESLLVTDVRVVDRTDRQVWPEAK